MRRARRLVVAGLLVATAPLVGCGDAPTPVGQVVLSANLEEDLAPDERKSLLGALHVPPRAVSFPDGEGVVEIEVVAARGLKEEGGKKIADLDVEPAYLRSVAVRVKDAAGYQLTAEVLGNPENVGSAEAPVHARLIKITRRKRTLFGSSLAEMTIRASPKGAERL